MRCSGTPGARGAGSRVEQRSIQLLYRTAGRMAGGKPSPPAQLHLEPRGTALVQEAQERTLTRAGGGGRTRGHLASRPERSMALSSPRTSFPIKAKNPLTGAPRARPIAPFSLHQTAPRHPGSL